MAREVGLGHERFARLLLEHSVILHNHSPWTSEIRLMLATYEQGASLDRVSDRFSYTAGTTVGTHLIITGVVMRDTHGSRTVGCLRGSGLWFCPLVMTISSLGVTRGWVDGFGCCRPSDGGLVSKGVTGADERC